LFLRFDVDDTFLADMYEGGIGSMKELGVTESYKLKRQVVISASEAAEMILRHVCCHFMYSVTNLPL